jgi:hypothetical protein
MNDVDADPGNPRLAVIPEPPGGNGAVDPIAQNIKNSVQDLQKSLMNSLKPACPGNAGWKTSVRLVRQSGFNNTPPATVVHNGGHYTPISSLKQKAAPAQHKKVNPTAQIIKRALLAHSNFLIKEMVKANLLDGNWRTIVRIVPADSTAGAGPDLGCGCGCSP